MKRIFLAMLILMTVVNVAWATDAQAGKMPKSGKLCTTRYYAPVTNDDGSVAISFTVRCSGEAKRRGLR